MMTEHSHYWHDRGYTPPISDRDAFDIEGLKTHDGQTVTLISRHGMELSTGIVNVKVYADGHSTHETIMVGKTQISGAVGLFRGATFKVIEDITT